MGFYFIVYKLFLYVLVNISFGGKEQVKHLVKKSIIQYDIITVIHVRYVWHTILLQLKNVLKILSFSM